VGAHTGKWKDDFVDTGFVEWMPNVTLKKLGRFRLSEPRFAVNPKATPAVDYSANAVNVWDLTTGKWLRKMRDTGHSAPPVYLRFSPYGKLLASASQEGEVLLWNAQTGQPSGTLDVAADLNDVGFRTKSNELVGVGHGFVYVWNFTTGAMKRTFEHSGYPTRVVAHPDGKFAAVADLRSSLIAFLDLESGKSLHSTAGSPVSLAFHPDGATLASLDGYGIVTTRDTTTGKKLHDWPEGKSGDNRYIGKRIAFLRGAKSLFVCKNDNVVIIDAESGKRLREFTFKNEDGRQVSDADLHPDGKRFVVTFNGKQDIEERDLESGKVLRIYPGYPHGASQVRYNLDGSRLATTGHTRLNCAFIPCPLVRIEAVNAALIN
jgi:WD40 repeat protein